MPDRQASNGCIQITADVVRLEIDLSQARRIRVIGTDGDTQSKRELVVTEKGRLSLD